MCVCKNDTSCIGMVQKYCVVIITLVAFGDSIPTCAYLIFWEKKEGWRGEGREGVERMEIKVKERGNRRIILFQHGSYTESLSHEPGIASACFCIICLNLALAYLSGSAYVTALSSASGVQQQSFI